MRYKQHYIRLFSVIFLALYTYFTYPTFHNNLIWFALAILLVFIGLFRNPIVVWGAGIVVITGFGGYHIYLWQFGDTLISFGWNEIIWLFIFPYTVLLGGRAYISNTMQQHEDQLSIYEYLQASQEQELDRVVMIDEQYQFVNGAAFVYKLEEEVLRALRERQEFVLVLIKINRFKAYMDSIGFEQAQNLLNEVASFIHNLPNPPAIKAHIGGGVMAVLLPSINDEDTVVDSFASFRSYLDDQFTNMLLIRPRRETQLGIRLKYGEAVCPTDGIEAKTLMDRAQVELEGSETGDANVSL